MWNAYILQCDRLDYVLMERLKFPLTEVPFLPFMLWPENKLLCMFQSHRVLSEGWAQRMLGVSKQRSSVYFPSGPSDMHTYIYTHTCTHWFQRSLHSSLSHNHHPIQIKDHMSCHTVGGGGVEKQGRTCGGCRAQNTNTSWLFLLLRLNRNVHT